MSGSKVAVRRRWHSVGGTLRVAPAESFAAPPAKAARGRRTVKIGAVGAPVTDPALPFAAGDSVSHKDGTCTVAATVYLDDGVRYLLRPEGGGDLLLAAAGDLGEGKRLDDGEPASPSTVERKAARGTAVIASDDDSGEVTAIVSVTGVFDEVDDNIEPGAYKGTLLRRTPKGVWSHDWDVWTAKTIEAAELTPGDPRLPERTRDGSPWPAEAGALRVKMRFNLATQAGREAYSNVVFFGDECEWSIGYSVRPGKSSRDAQGRRRIREIELFEYSPVLFGAMPLCGTVPTKSRLRVTGERGSTMGDETKTAGTAVQDALAELHAAALAELDWTEVDGIGARVEEAEAGGLDLAADDSEEGLGALWSDDATKALLARLEAEGAVVLTDAKAEGGTDRNRGNAEQLRHWYVHGEGAAKIAWGTPGDFKRCVAIAGEHMTPGRAKGYCFAGETLVTTPDGPRRIDELADEGRALVLTTSDAARPVFGSGRDRVVRRDGVWRDVEVRSFGEQRLLTVTLVRHGERKVIRATPEHRWFASPDGRTASRHTLHPVTTEQLRPGMALPAMLPLSGVMYSTPSPSGIAAGVVFGDGTIRGERAGAMVDLWGEKDEQLLRYFDGHPTSPVKTARGVLGTRVSGLPASWKQPPALSEGHGYLFGWLAGYVAADGTVSKDGTVSLSSADRGNLEFAAVVAHRLGIATHGIKTRMRVGIDASEATALHKLTFVTATVPASMLLVREHRARHAAVSGDAGIPVRWRVESVEDVGEAEEVFCAVVPGSELFVLDGWIVTRNCALRHKEATGEWPGPNAHGGGAEHAAESAAKTAEIADDTAKSAEGGEGKSVRVDGIDGSYEATIGSVARACRAGLGGTPVQGERPWSVRVVATFDGTAVVERTRWTDADGPTSEAWRVPYTVGEDGTVTLGQPEKVNLTLTVESAKSLVGSRVTVAADGTVTLERAPESPAGDGTEAKSYPYLAGSVEERQAAISEAVRDAMSGNVDDRGRAEFWPSIHATFPEYVIVTRYAWRDDDGETTWWRLPYVISDDGTVALGEPSPVELAVSVQEAPAAGDGGGTYAETAQALVKALDGIAEVKAGRVLSQQNEGRIVTAVTHLVEVLRAAGVDVEIAPAEIDKPSSATDRALEDASTSQADAPAGGAAKGAEVPEGHALIPEGDIAEALALLT